MLHFDECSHVFYEWPLNAVFYRKLSLQSCRWKYCTNRDGTQTYDFTADKSCLLFSIILKLLSGWEVIRTQGKCIKSYKNFWKDFVVEQNLEHSSEGQLLKLSESSIWDCSRLGWPHDWEYESLSHGPVSRANFDKFHVPVSCAW